MPCKRQILRLNYFENVTVELNEKPMHLVTKKSKQWIFWRNYEEIRFTIDLTGLKSGSKDKWSCDPHGSFALIMAKQCHDFFAYSVLRHP